MLIAVASKSGTEIDTHFGHAEKFLIYEYARGECRKVEEVSVDRYCSFDPDHPFRHAQFDTIAGALKDCRAVVIQQIGQLPSEELQKLGIKPITTTGPIEEALRKAHDEVCGGRCKSSGPCEMS